MNETERHIENLFLPLPSGLAELAQQLRLFLKKETRPTRELVFSSYNSINIGYGFTDKAWDCYCGIIIYSKHINISFPSGAELPDPEKLLRGTGSRVRHLRIENFDTIKQPAVLALLKQARDNAWDLISNKDQNENTLMTIFKGNSSKK